jgi:DNA-binding NtrC family response regulator
MAAAVAFLPPAMALSPLSLALGIAATVLAYSLLYWGLWPLVWRLVAPAGGRLLDAVDRSIDRMASASSFEDIARAVLMPLREASGSPSADPLLYIFNPQQELHLDAAGQPHTGSRSMSGPLADYLGQKRGEIVLRDPLQASIVRQPPLRPLVEVLVSLDAFCVLPLLAGDHLEGALVIPKGVRKSSITLEELEALRRLSRHMVGLVDVLSAQARAEQRANELSVAHAQAASRVLSLQEELTTLGAEARLLKAGRSTEALTRPQVAYSKSMRELLNRISEVATNSSHALLVAESGTPLESLAYLLHERSERAGHAFMIGDCASASAEGCGGALFGQKQKDGDFPGWLRLAEGGTLLLLDLPAMPSEVQRTLGWALATRHAQAIDGDAPYLFNACIIATSGSEMAPLVAAGALDAELAKRLEPGVIRVPPLRDRTEDLSSLVLLELNRASRVLGREPIGIEAEALEILQGHSWPGNLDELRLVIERAVAKARTARVYPADLPALGTSVTPKVEKSEFFEGTFEDAERRILEQAIANAGGNKSQAARMLGLKRTTFLDKLKRYRLDDDGAIDPKR